MAFRVSKTTRRLTIVSIAVIVIAVYWFWPRSEQVRYITANVTRGSVVRAVSATGTVNPVITVQVGSYVSGPIKALYADFNTPVKAGEVIAKIDPRTFDTQVAQAKAALANAEAQLRKDEASRNYDKLSYERNKRLFAEDAVSLDTVDSVESTYLQAEAQVALDRANIQQQQANLGTAEVNLNYTNIISPVDGTVVARNVDVGQTVAASFQTPTLFLIAKDLTQMQVDTNVSESDIGDVKEGERSEFKVDAFPDRTFVGSVAQVRQAPITVQNVVTYDVVVAVPNPELLLKPGMTANVTIVTARRDNVVRVPIEALRFSPPSVAAADRAESNRDQTAGREGDQSAGAARVWELKDGQPVPVSIQSGLDDGTWVEVLNDGLAPGTPLVISEVRRTANASGQSPMAVRYPH